MGTARRIKAWGRPWKAGSEPGRPTLLEILEPRILLSADGLLNAIIPDQGEDTLIDGIQEVVQYAELLDINDQVEEQIKLELAPSDTSNSDVYQPIFTLFVDDDNTNDESVDADLSVDNIGSTLVNAEINVLSNDSDGDIESTVGTTEDERMPTYINDADLSIEYATSIEIRGPPLNESVNVDSEKSEADFTTLSEYAVEVQASGTIDIPDLYLVDPTVDYFDGQIIYLDFDGEEDVTYDGPLTIEGIDVPAFSLQDHLAGQEEIVIAKVMKQLNRMFTGSGVVFTGHRPAESEQYSTVFIGGGILLLLGTVHSWGSPRRWM